MPMGSHITNPDVQATMADVKVGGRRELSWSHRSQTGHCKATIKIGWAPVGCRPCEIISGFNLCISSHLHSVNRPTYID
jgi:hypothetical protein